MELTTPELIKCKITSVKCFIEFNRHHFADEILEGVEVVSVERLAEVLDKPIQAAFLVSNRQSSAWKKTLELELSFRGLDSRDQSRSRSRLLNLSRSIFEACQDFFDCRETFFFCLCQDF